MSAHAVFTMQKLAAAKWAVPARVGSRVAVVVFCRTSRSEAPYPDILHTSKRAIRFPPVTSANVNRNITVLF